MPNIRTVVISVTALLLTAYAGGVLFKDQLGGTPPDSLSAEDILALLSIGCIALGLTLLRKRH